MRKIIIAGNWKMHKTVQESLELTKSLAGIVSSSDSRDVVVCPPLTSLYAVGQSIKGTPLALGAQNMYFEESGAYTGEVAPAMIADCGAAYVIVGHSERREYFGETNAVVNNKINAAIKHSITPIFCVGESLAQREAEETMSFIAEQLTEGLADISSADVKSMVIAYEPIWAIGTGKTATSDQAEEVCGAIRNTIASLYDVETSEAVRIQYGGSVKGDNAAEILAKPNIDGALVGGASLTTDAFMAIVNAK